VSPGRVGCSGCSDPNGSIVRSLLSRRLAVGLAATGIAVAAALSAPSAANATALHHPPAPAPKPVPTTTHYITAADVLPAYGATTPYAPDSWHFDAFHNESSAPITAFATFIGTGLSSNGTIIDLFHTLPAPVAGNQLAATLAAGSYTGTNVGSFSISTGTTAYTADSTDLATTTWNGGETTAHLAAVLVKARTPITSIGVVFGDQTFSGKVSKLVSVTFDHERNLFTPAPAPTTTRYITASTIVSENAPGFMPAPGVWGFFTEGGGVTTAPSTTYLTFGPNGATTINGGLIAIQHQLNAPVAPSNIADAFRGAYISGTNIDSVTLLGTGSTTYTADPGTSLADPTWNGGESTAQVEAALTSAGASISGFTIVLGDQKHTGVNSTITSITFDHETSRFTPAPTHR
jgi:hypothetical protein